MKSKIYLFLEGLKYHSITPLVQINTDVSHGFIIWGDNCTVSKTGIKMGEECNHETKWDDIFSIMIPQYPLGVNEEIVNNLALLKEKFPEIEFEFENRMLNGRQQDILFVS